MSVYTPQAGEGQCICGGKTIPGLSVKPIKGDAVLFWSMVCSFLSFLSKTKSDHGL